MIRRPPRSTRTDTLCPYTTLFRSTVGSVSPHTNRQALQTPNRAVGLPPRHCVTRLERAETFQQGRESQPTLENGQAIAEAVMDALAEGDAVSGPPPDVQPIGNGNRRRVAVRGAEQADERPEARRVGKEVGSTSRYR